MLQRKSSVGLFILLGASLALASCTIVIVSGPSTVSIGETVTYVLDLGTDLGGDTGVTLYVIADVPDGWDLTASFFDGTIGGVPMAGEPTVVDSTTCSHLAGDVLPGFQRIYLAAGPFDVTAFEDTGTATLEFEVNDQPAGEYQIFFRFAAFADTGDCSTPAVRTINRQSPGFLGFLGAVFDDTDGADGLGGTRGLAVTADGRHLVAAGTGDHGIAVFSRDPAGGGLTFLEAHFDDAGGVDGLRGAKGVTTTPDGRHVYVASSWSTDNSLAAFARDVTTGELTFIAALEDGIGGVDGLASAQSVDIAPDGRHVYVAAPGDHSVAAFARDEITGELEFVQKIAGSASGVEEASGVAVAPDGQHVYVAARSGDFPVDGALAVFARDDVTGELTYVEALLDGIDGVDGLRGAYAVAVSPDGVHVYVAAWREYALAAFARNPETGELTYLGAHFHGAGGIYGMEWPRSVTVDPGGRHVFVGGENSVAVFARNPATGALTFLEAQFQGDPPNDGIQGLFGLAPAPADLPGDYHLYTAANAEGSLAAFRPSSEIFSDGFESGNTFSWSSTTTP